jgi:hypothetical protein
MAESGSGASDVGPALRRRFPIMDGKEPQETMSVANASLGASAIGDEIIPDEETNPTAPPALVQYEWQSATLEDDIDAQLAALGDQGFGFCFALNFRLYFSRPRQ